MKLINKDIAGYIAHRAQCAVGLADNIADNMRINGDIQPDHEDADADDPNALMVISDDFDWASLFDRRDMHEAAQREFIKRARLNISQARRDLQDALTNSSPLSQIILQPLIADAGRLHTGVHQLLSAIDGKL